MAKKAAGKSVHGPLRRRGAAAQTPPLPGHRVIVFLQENKTTDFYFAGLSAWGAAVANGGNLLAAPPNFDQPHDRNAWVHYAMGDYPALPVQIDTDSVIPFYAWLAKEHTFCDHHFGLGSNSTPGHMLAIGGQTPTLKNPPFVGPHPTWNIPSIFSLADAAGMSWAAFPDADGYPTKFYASLAASPATDNIHPPSQFIPMAKAGTLPQICYVWSPAGYDEHPPATNNPGYVTNGHDLIWQRVQAVIDGGGWPETTFILTWDDWGGYADSVRTPNVETAVDAIHPNGFQVIGGSRIPLIMFGGKVAQGVDARWHSHASIPKTVIDLLGLPAMGVPRVDTAPSMADRVDRTLSRPPPPAYGTAITQPTPPTPTPAPVDPGPWPGPTGQPMPALVTLDGSPLPAPSDAVVRPNPPKPPAVPLPVPLPTPDPPPSAPPGPPPNIAELVDKKYAAKTAADLAGAPLTALKGVSPTKAAALTQALGVQTIGDLATNKFVEAAQAISAAAGSGT
jgi:hypothetical protein